MKKILLDGNKNYYKANLHCHSTKSDGKMTVEEIKERGHRSAEQYRHRRVHERIDRDGARLFGTIVRDGAHNKADREIGEN